MFIRLLGYLLGIISIFKRVVLKCYHLSYCSCSIPWGSEVGTRESYAISFLISYQRSSLNNTLYIHFKIKSFSFVYISLFFFSDFLFKACALTKIIAFIKSLKPGKLLCLSQHINYVYVIVFFYL